MEAAERARLIEAHLDVVRRAAALIHPRVQVHVELDELIALGNAGLAEAAQRFEPERGVAFSTYAWYRVQGAIIDGIRRSTNLPRRTWAKLLALRAASDYLEHRAERDRGAAQHGTPPPEGAEALARVREALSAIRTVYVTSLESLRDAEQEPADDAPGPDTRLAIGRLSARLRGALEALPERERTLVTKHYWEGKNLLEAGAEMGISKSWASRLHAQAVERLRSIVDAESSLADSRIRG